MIYLTMKFHDPRLIIRKPSGGRTYIHTYRQTDRQTDRHNVNGQIQYLAAYLVNTKRLSSQSPMDQIIPFVQSQYLHAELLTIEVYIPRVHRKTISSKYAVYIPRVQRKTISSK
ncbi:hypothetical protein DPMN_146528 [Dreissena polymorpha]|uniref:Uncharacterized protein n=1 Tax=Dreissena polymorpha TaxID=45954 RepID=A0A9D4IYH7_DREPO|nr:hypothetical protein DPMN_146528 [Dreissena polymorpha]